MYELGVAISTAISRVFCWLNIHDWRNGPGNRCTECNEPDWLYYKEE